MMIRSELHKIFLQKWLLLWVNLLTQKPIHFQANFTCIRDKVSPIGLISAKSENSAILRRKPDFHSTYTIDILHKMFVSKSNL